VVNPSLGCGNKDIKELDLQVRDYGSSQITELCTQSHVSRFVLSFLIFFGLIPIHSCT
jgi:hypothetical protein